MLLDDFLSNFIQTTDYPTLDAMHFFMNKLNHPDKKLKFIHVAGTNGKGSICEMLNNILMLSNYKVGKFISPHLLVSNESICINNKQITDSEFLKYKETFENLSTKYFNETGRKITRFEVLTSLAILYFAEHNCDIVILEVGLGGLYDCTNIVNSIISVFGTIGFDHTAILGNTLEEIAAQKAGIIKENSNTVIFNQPALAVIEKECKKKHSNLTVIEFSEISNYSINSEYQIFDFGEYKNLQVNLQGKKQLENACIAIKCIEILNNKHLLENSSKNLNNENGRLAISKSAIYEGLKTVVHPARFEEVSKSPKIIFDGAHNEDAMKNLVETVNTLYSSNEKTFLISIITTKDYKKVLDILINSVQNAKFIFTDGTDENKFFKGQLLYDYTKSIIEEKNFKNAYNKSNCNSNNTVNITPQIEMMSFENGLKSLNSEINFVVGSFYTYEKTKELLK